MPTIAQAQAAFLREGGPKGGTSKGGVYVVKQGKNKADFSKVSGNLGVVQAMIAQYIADFIKNAEDNLKESKSNTTGALTDSLDFEIVSDRNGYTINFTALDYYKFVDKGVRGAGASRKNKTSPYKYKDKMPPIAPIAKWIKDNRLTARATDVKRYGATGRERKAIPVERAQKTLAYLIARSIYRDGLRATNFFTDALNDTFKDFGQNLSKALGASITINLQQMADQFKKGQGVNIPR
jgi:hypothetical protein